MNLIVAVDSNWGIGYKGKLLQSIPEDMKFFKQITTDKVVVMGDITFKSLPKQEPLKDRINIVLSNESSLNNKNKDIIICSSVDQLFDQLKNYDSDDIFIIGGESIYKQFLSYCKVVYITKIKKQYKADKYFPNLDNRFNWELVSISDLKVYKDIQFRFLKYVNINNINK